MYLKYLILAHENYVLPKADIDRGMMDQSVNVFGSLKNSHNLMIAFWVGIASVVIIGLYLWYAYSKIGIKIDRQLNKLEPFGHVVLRTALGISFIASGYFSSFLGPEIPLSSVPLGVILRPVLFVIGTCLLLGAFTEAASIFGLAILVLTTVIYKSYMVTYFNYYGELLALIFFGSRIFSFDKLIIKSKIWLKNYKDWEIPLIRITYGLSVVYPAITIKIFHPSIIVEIAEKYNLAQFHWLFPSDPLLISLGTGVTQIMVGLAIIFGFATRINSLVTFILYVMSIVFFKEAVWPHYILLSLALYLVINDGGKFSIDYWLKHRLNKLHI